MTWGLNLEVSWNSLSGVCWNILKTPVEDFAPEHVQCRVSTQAFVTRTQTGALLSARVPYRQTQRRLL